MAIKLIRMFKLFKKFSIHRYHLISFAAGAFYASAFPMFFGQSFFPSIFFSLGLLLFIFQELPTFKQRIIPTLLFSLGLVVVGYYWIPYTLNEFGAIPFPLNQIIGTAFSLIVLPQIFFYSFLELKLKKYLPQFHTVLAQSLIWILCEYFVPQQFPAHLGHSFLVFAPYLKLAPVMGVPGYSFIVFAITMSFVCWYKSRKIEWITIASTFILLVYNFSGQIERPATAINTKYLNLRLVQPNVGNFIKLQSERGDRLSVRQVFNSYYELSVSQSSEFARPDLIVWPETAFPHLVDSGLMQEHESYIPELVKNVIATSQSEMVIGGYDINPQAKGMAFEGQFNSALHFDQSQHFVDAYYKMKLIPFGETLPFGSFNQALGEMLPEIAFFATGEKFQLMKSKKEAQFSLAICYEILFSSFVRNYLNSIPQKPHFILNLTNDSWYGKTAEPFQHLFLAKWRAVEFQLPLVRSTNTGITSVTFNDGIESKRLYSGEKGTLDLKLPLIETDKTLFQKFGIWIMTLTIFVCYLVDLSLKRKSFFK